MFPGIGYGGSCFPKDVQALEKSAIDSDYDFRILKAVMQVNEKQKTSIIPKMLAYFKNNLKGKRIALWGLAFKPDTDDIREAPALYLIDALTMAGATVCAYDPEGMNNVKNLLGDKILYANNPYQALENADALLIATEWNIFRTPDFEQLEKLLKAKVIFDGRNLYSPQQMREMGYYYCSVGRELVQPAN